MNKNYVSESSSWLPPVCIEDRREKTVTQIINWYRTCIVVATASYLIWFFLPFIDTSWHTDKELQILSFDSYGSLINYPEGLIKILLISYVAIVFGVFLFSRVARTLYTIYVTLFLFLLPLDGLRVQTGIESFFLDCSNVLTGMTIVMMYMTSLSKKFK